MGGGGGGGGGGTIEGPRAPAVNRMEAGRKG